jgi:hypothetical protein
VAAVTEIASGLTDERPTLKQLLIDARWACSWWSTETD